MAHELTILRFDGRRLKTKSKRMPIFERRLEIDEIDLNAQRAVLAHKPDRPFRRIKTQAASIVHKPAQAPLFGAKPKIGNRLRSIHKLASAGFAAKHGRIPHDAIASGDRPRGIGANGIGNANMHKRHFFVDERNLKRKLAHRPARDSRERIIAE